MGEKRITIPDKRKMRNLIQYRDMSDEDFDKVFARKVLNVTPSVEFEKRIEKKLVEFEKDYELNDLKINDMDTLRALVQAQIALEDYEQFLFKERANTVSLDNIVLIDKIQKVMSDLRSDISSFQNDLKITRKFRKSDQETSIISFIDSLKAKAKKFSESKMSYVYCDRCNMLVATIWTLYPTESKNKLRFVCNRPTENGETGEICGQVMNVSTKELFENGGTNHPELMPEGML
jgi:hypothetical protein